MLFNSLDFCVFLVVVLSLYYVLPLRGRQVLLVVSSFYFYLYWNVKYSSIILFFIILDYTAGRLISAAKTQRARKQFLLLSLSCNLGVLAIFKYYNFFMSTTRDLGLITGVRGLGLLLPLGISFHTFQTMSYTIDVYRRKIEPETSFLRFAVFVSMFPQMVAGPIERATEILPQIGIEHRFDWDGFVIGSRRVLEGLVKKVVLADNFAVLVNRVYGTPQEFSGYSILLATWLFAWQIYFDFSGYSDIAIGTARLLGFRFSENFNMPYVSTSIQEFWRRWHISLSSWLRDYLYISLGGNRKGEAHTYANLLITMLLGGLWHGASWNFVIWGGLHGVWLAIERWWSTVRGPRVHEISGLARGPLVTGLKKALLGFAVFNGVCLTWVFFRAETVHEAVLMLRRVVQWTPGATITHDYSWARIVMIAMFGALYFTTVHVANTRYRRFYWPTSVAAVLAIVLFGAKSNEFIYFTF